MIHKPISLPLRHQNLGATKVVFEVHHPTEFPNPWRWHGTLRCISITWTANERGTHGVFRRESPRKKMPYEGGTHGRHRQTKGRFFLADPWKVDFFCKKGNQYLENVAGCWLLIFINLKPLGISNPGKPLKMIPWDLIGALEIPSKINPTQEIEVFVENILFLEVHSTCSSSFPRSSIWCDCSNVINLRCWSGKKQSDLLGLSCSMLGKKIQTSSPKWWWMMMIYHAKLGKKITKKHIQDDFFCDLSWYKIKNQPYTNPSLSSAIYRYILI